MSDRFGVPLRSVLRLEHWFWNVPGRKTLWRALNSEWVEVATSTSTRVLGDKFSTGTYVVTAAKDDPNGTVEIPLEVPRGGSALFTF